MLPRLPERWALDSTQGHCTGNAHQGGRGEGRGRGRGGRGRGASAQNKAPAKVNLDHISQFPQRSPAVPKHRSGMWKQLSEGRAGNAFLYRVPQCVQSDVRQVAEPRFWHGDSSGTSWTLKAAGSTRLNGQDTLIWPISTRELPRLLPRGLPLAPKFAVTKPNAQLLWVITSRREKERRRRLWEASERSRVWDTVHAAHLSPVSGLWPARVPPL